MRSLTLIIAATILLASVLSLNSIPSGMVSHKILARSQTSTKALRVFPNLFTLPHLKGDAARLKKATWKFSPTNCFYKAQRATARYWYKQIMAKFASQGIFLDARCQQYRYPTRIRAVWMKYLKDFVPQKGARDCFYEQIGKGCNEFSKYKWPVTWAHM